MLLEAYRCLEGLRQLGIQVPDSSPRADFPLPWLIRGESNLSTVTAGTDLLPHPGMMGTFGVFMADNLQGFIPKDIVYIYHRDDVTGTWLTLPSPHADEEIQAIAARLQLNLTSITGGILAEQRLYHDHNVYQRKTGVATTPVPLQPQNAYAVLVRGGYLESSGNSPADTLRDKIVYF